MVWTRQKQEQTHEPPAPREQADPAAASGLDRRPPSQNRTPQPRSSIGKSVRIRGEVIADEDITIEGTVDGNVTVKDHTLAIGPNSRITKAIRAKSVVVEGEVQGNITAADRVEIATTGSMLGDIVAPRVVLADGARFKGSIDMEPGSAKRSSDRPEPATADALTRTA